MANPLAAGHYYIHVGVGRGAEGSDPVAFRKNAADFVVYGTRSFGGLVALFRPRPRSSRGGTTG